MSEQTKSVIEGVMERLEILADLTGERQRADVQGAGVYEALVAMGGEARASVYSGEHRGVGPYVLEAVSLCRGKAAVEALRRRDATTEEAARLSGAEATTHEPFTSAAVS